MATTPNPTPLEVAQGRLAAYLAAEQDILLKSQSYQVGDGSEARQILRARLAEVQQGIASVQSEIGTLTATAGGQRRVYYLRSR